MPSLTSPNSPTHADIPPFPSPQTFDILPEIYAVIARLQLASHSPNELSTAHPTEALAPKDLPVATVPIKLKIQKARAAVQALPDVGRTVEEQEREIQSLERRNESLRIRVDELARLAKQAREADNATSAERGSSS